ncbi:MAG TPA: MEDS domain-containing protein [Anaeromyxobacter sp.]|nr:MEDS domain-containing protein [Anaeromyxobacter sp.]
MVEPARTVDAFVQDLRWGTHLCHFYGSRDDLVDTLVPYFAQGLRANEKCLWVTAEPLRAADAATALSAAVPDLAARRARGQVEILDHSEWYQRGGATNTAGALSGWVEREERALAEGWAGLRLTGNTAFLQRHEWSGFLDYEAQVSGTFAPRRIVGLCSYPLHRCGAAEVLDVVRTHDYALSRREGAWEVVESASARVARSELARVNTQLEARVAERTAALEAALRARDDFLAVASHELRTPLSALRLSVAALVRAADQGVSSDDDARRRLARAEAQCHRLVRLVETLLDVTRVRSGQLALALDDVDLAALAGDVLDRMGDTLVAAGCCPLLRADAPVRGRWDRVRLEQVLTNLLQNAARYAGGGPVEVEVRALHGAAVVTVRDHGPGISPARRARLFEAFERIDRDDRRGGLGLGLWIAKRVVEAHGGRIELRDAPGGGCAFVVTLPAAV